MRIKLSDLVPPGEVWIIDTKKIVICQVVDVNSTHTVPFDITNLHQAVPDFEPEIDLFKKQLKSDIDRLLQEKTGWGRVELLKRLLELIDGTGNPNKDLKFIDMEPPF